MTAALAHGARVVYRPYGWFATHLGPTDCGVRIRWDDATEIVVNPHTLDVWPHPVTLVPRAEIRRIYADHGVPSFPQIEGDGVVDLMCVELSARDSREMAEDSDNALRLTAIADDLDELVARYESAQEGGR
jgi:hypothetical protein